MKVHLTSMLWLMTNMRTQDKDKVKYQGQILEKKIIKSIKYFRVIPEVLSFRPHICYEK